MKALSYRQPWAWLVAMGIKPIENRTWKCPEKYIGKRILIHASAKWDDNHREMSRLFTPDQWKSLSRETQLLMSGGTLPLKAIIGSVEIVDCVVNHSSLWSQHEAFNWKYDRDGNLIKNTTYNWVLAHPILFPEPIPCKGSLSFWDYPNILAEPEEEGGSLYCHCRLSVKEDHQVRSNGDGTYSCRYCGGKWYK